MNLKIIPTIETKEIFEDTFSINLNNHVYSYLIIGKEKAILIDTGWGLIDLWAAVLAITTLPLIVINTHGHLDHIYGNNQFDNIFIRDEDVSMMQNDFTEEKRTNIIKQYETSFLAEGLTEEKWAKAKLNRISSLNEIIFFDIGERIIEIVSTPGHTIGSVCLLDK